MSAVSAARVVGVVGLFASIYIENGSCRALEILFIVFRAVPNHFGS